MARLVTIKKKKSTWPMKFLGTKKFTEEDARNRIKEIENENVVRNTSWLMKPNEYLIS